MTVPLLRRVPLRGRHRGGVTVVSLRGELDVRDVPALRACLGGIRWRGRPDSVVDLAELAFIDCACLAVLIRHAADIAARGGSVALAGPHGSVLRILSLTGLLTSFEVRDTLTPAAAGGRVHRSVIFPRPAGTGRQQMEAG